MILTHGSNSISSSPSTDIFFEFISSVLTVEQASNIYKTTIDSVEMEYFGSGFNYVTYPLPETVNIVEFDLYLASSVQAVDFGLRSSSQSRPHLGFNNVQAPVIITRFGTNGFDNISFPSYSNLVNVEYKQNMITPSYEYCKGLYGTDTIQGITHYRYDVDSSAKTITVTATDISNDKSYSATLYDSAGWNISHLLLQVEAVSHRTDFCFKNFHIVY